MNPESTPPPNEDGAAPEAAAESTAPAKKPFTGYTEDDRVKIAQLTATQTQLAMNDTEFCFGAELDTTTWSRLKKGIYFTVQGPTKKLVALQRHVKNLLQQRQMRDNRGSRGLSGGDYIPFSDYDAIRVAVNSALATSQGEGEDKLIVYVAATGGGKTRAGLQLMREGFRTCMVTARPSWSKSYFPALVAIAEGLGMNDSFRIAHQVETLVLQKMQKDRGLLIVNETEMLCKAVEDFLRNILNETSWAILILITPEGFRRMMMRGGSGIEQLMRRSEAVIHASPLTGAQVLQFFEQHWRIDADLKIAAREAADEANRFGAFDFVCRVITLCVEEFGAETPTLEQIRGKIAAARNQMPLTRSAERRAAR